ncbi:MAG: SDR family NAD(P)-dependent oxidoreductase [Catenulispora sp.]|nr:SDR family NAD(P)-dependent oxidoreductase [Catenulispora sp.]
MKGPMVTEDKLRAYLKRVTVDLAEARRRLAEAEGGRREPIAVVGMACRYPGGAETVDDFWELLRDGRDTAVEVPKARWDVDEYYDEDRRNVGTVYTRSGSFLADVAGFDASFFGMSPQEAFRMDPQQRLLMELMWEGMEDAGTTPGALAGSRTAVMVGLMDTVQYGRLEVDSYGPAVVADPLFGQGISTSVAAGRLAYHYDLRGPTLTLDTACSSSLVGVHLAAEALRRGECDLAVAAGAYLMLQADVFVQGCATSMLAADARGKTFDARADGYVIGEGGGLVVLERLSSALANGRRIRAVLRGSAVNQDGRSNGLTAPNRGAQEDVIRRAQAVAGVAPDEVAYVEAHGSGTRLGDAIELSALHDVFGAPGTRPADRPLLVGAVKTNIGHTQSAAGIAGLIKTVLVLENGIAPANRNFENPSDAIPADGTVQPLAAATPLPEGGTVAGVSSFGWSGTNVHLVVEKAPEADTQASEKGVTPFILPVSAANPEALRARMAGLAAWLGDRQDVDVADLEHTLWQGRAGLDHRHAVVCDDREDAIRQLSTEAAGVQARRRPRVAFLLPGTGDQYAGLGRELYDGEPVYAAAVDECLEILEQRCRIVLRPLFFPDTDAAPAADGLAAMLGRDGGSASAPETDPLARAENSHPFLFTVEYALAKLLEHWGVRPDLLVGYSLGEYVAACLAGVLTVGDALRVVVERARLIATALPGRMLAVAADEQRVGAVLADSGARVDVAALTGPSMTVLSGTADQVDVVAAALRAAGIAARPLHSEHAFHSSLLTPVREKLAALVDSVPRAEPAVTIVTNTTGAALTAEQAAAGEYWADHLVSPIRFADSVRTCLAEGVDVFVELGPGAMLGGLVRQNLDAGSGVAVINTLPSAWSGGERPDIRAALAATAARLWEHGVSVARPTAGRIVTLPPYPFQRTVFWPEPASGAVKAPARRSKPAPLCYAPTWRRDIAHAVPASLPLPGPLVVFADEDASPDLAELAAAAGVAVTEVIPGTGLRRDGRRVVIDPAAADHYRQLFADLPGDGPVHVVHAWGPRTSAGDDAELRESTALGFDSLLLAVQALGVHAAGREVRLLTVTRGAGEVLGGELDAPHQAAVHGLGRVVHHEYRNLTWRGVDLDPDAPHAADLARELLIPRWEPALAGWRRGRRWLQDWAEVPLDDPARTASTTTTASTTGPATPANIDSPWRADGVYLITGGTRGLGMALAKHLARSGVRKLALVGRSAVERTAPDIVELASAGVEVLLLQADVGIPDQLRAALKNCRDWFGALHGVIHAAGVPAEGMMQRRTPAEAQAVLAPKVLAMGPLAELVGPGTPEAERPELLVLYSSAITVLGGIGEGDYCAANTVLDAYGAALAASAPSTRVVTVAWGQWQHDAWQSTAPASGLAERAAAYRREYGFELDAGNALLDRIVRSATGSVVAVQQRLEESLAEWSKLLDLDQLVDAGSVAPAAERFPRPQMRTEYVAPRDARETAVAEIWQAYLGIDKVGVHDPFFDLGGNSLVGLAMVLAVEKELGLSIAPAVLFEHPTVAAFAAALDPAGGAAAVTELITTSSARGQRRRQARTGTNRGNRS